MDEHFEFNCDGDRLVGLLYLPQGAPRAALVTTGPLTSVKEQATGAYARAIARRGSAALAFDHHLREARASAPVRESRSRIATSALRSRPFGSTRRRATCRWLP
jgi:fermentation-respiration switch protein FrsA (DUF1100 family)